VSRSPRRAPRPLWRLPATAGPDAKRLVVTRGLRGFADGAVSVLLASYLTALGLSSFQVGALVTGTLLGSAALTLGVGLLGAHLGRKKLLIGASALMLATGVGFARVTAFWPLMLVAVVGTLNPSAGDVSVFLPTEQAVLAGAVASRDRTATFAWYNLSGAVAGAVGALASGIPVALAHRFGWNLVAAERSAFVAYAALAVATAIVYSGLSPSLDERRPTAGPRPAPLARSRAIVLRLSALFSIDSFGGGFVVQSLLVLWLHRRFHLDVATTGAVFFAAGLLGAASQLVSSHLAARIGLVETMVFTHLPSNVLLILAGLVPSAPLAITLLLLRATVSQMDVPARQSYVMAVVPPEERTAASSVTNVPRSLASALAPLGAGLLLDRTAFGWPLIIAGALKATYDVLLLVQFRSVRPLDERG
jgi:predicted MFS family arabinose efflux permease